MYGQSNSKLKHTKIDNILESLAFYSEVADTKIDSINVQNNLKINFHKKFDEIDSLLQSGIEPFYPKELIPQFKEYYFEYRNGNKEKAVLGLQELMNKGFAPATLVYSNSIKDENEKMKILKLGISQCCDACTIQLLKNQYDDGKQENIDLPSKCYNTQNSN